MAFILPRFPTFSLARWVAVSRLLLALAIAWTLAQATWLFWPTDGRVGEGAYTAQPRATPAQPTYRLQSVADLSLYGSAQAVGSGLNAPQTQLNLTLRGVWANPSRQLGRAIIAGNGSEEAYKVGDALPGGATLDEVFSDRVILKRGGRLEALYLPKDSMEGIYSAPAGVMPSSSSYEPVSVPPSADVGFRLQEYRQRILNDPQEVFSLARMQPVMEDGKLKGYKLSPNKEKELFRDIGLRPGDVVTSVNGLSLSDPAAAGQVMTQVSSASQLTLVVDRGGRLETLVVPISK